MSDYYCEARPPAPEHWSGRHLRRLFTLIHWLYKNNSLGKIILTNTGDSFGRYYYNLRIFIETCGALSEQKRQKLKAISAMLTSFETSETEEPIDDEKAYRTITHWIYDMEKEAVVSCDDYGQFTIACEVVSQILWGIDEGIEIECDTKPAYERHKEDHRWEKLKEEKVIRDDEWRKWHKLYVQNLRKMTDDVSLLESELNLLESKYKYPEVQNLVLQVRKGDVSYEEYIKNKVINNKLREIASLKKRISKFQPAQI